MPADEPTTSYADAAEVCAKPWPNWREAYEQARGLDRAGWRVEWRHPPVEFGHGSGVLIVASVYHPQTWVCPGDVTYTEQHSAHPVPSLRAAPE
jgi:hypothetical protein